MSDDDLSLVAAQAVLAGEHAAVYGYGVIGNTYKHYKYYLDRSRKADVDGRFYITMRDKVCGGYFVLFRATCRRIALVYWGFVRVKGNPKNGANAT